MPSGKKKKAVKGPAAKKNNSGEANIGNLAEMFNFHSDPIFIFDITLSDKPGKIIGSNNAAVEAYGFSTAEFQKMKFTDIITDKISTQEQASMFSGLKVGGRIITTYNTLTKDGKIIPVEANTKVINIDSIIHGISVFRDISSRIQNELEIKQSEKKYRLLFEGMIDAFSYNKAIINSKGKMTDFIILEANSSFEKIAGVKKSEIIGKKCSEVMYWLANDKGKWIDQFELTVSDGRVNEFEGYSEYTKKWYLFRSYSNDRGYFMLVMQDITQRKQNELVIMKAEKYFKNIIEDSTDAILVIDKNGKLRLVSPSILRLTGYSYVIFEDFNISEMIKKLVPDINRQRIYTELFGEIIANTKNKYMNFEMVIITQSGSESVLEIASHNMLGEEPVDGIVINIRDITERKKSEETLKAAVSELERSNYDLEQFAYIASHDLKEPLRMIANYLELIKTRYAEPMGGELSEFVNYAHSGTARMYELVQGILSYSRAGKGEISQDPVDINDLIKEAVNNLGKPEVLNLIRTKNLPKIRLNRYGITQVFQNLIGNAIKFNKKNAPSVEVLCRETAKEWLFTVKDNGIGIDPEYHDRIFKMFERLYSDVEYPGSGIGLALCKKIVEKHGGTIWVDSQPDKGSSFTFTIPKKGD